ncbi:MAG: T9SS type A sorting domain-containing protein [Candidatus Kapabacteria bacterium]|nr:T9SS type A sorting domain-containing protein [Candidatus Kapabacteria bacterium]
MLGVAWVSAFAQFQLRVVSAVDSASYPRLSVLVRATLNGSPTALEDAGVLVASSRYSIRPERVEMLNNPQGIARIWWLADPRLQTEPTATIVAWKGTQLAQDSVRLPRMPIVRILNSRREPVEELDFGTVSPGTSTTKTFFVQLFIGRYDQNGAEMPIRVDSVVSSSPVFRAEWVGWIAAPQPLPAPVYSPLPYTLRISCTPPDTQYYTGLLRIHYDGALVLVVPLRCNSFVLPAAQQLRFVWPLEPERLAPCSEVTLRWSGMAADALVAVDYSLDSGRTWTEMTRTADSTLVWTVPNVPTSGLRFRLRQLDAVQRLFSLQDQNPTPVARIAFRADGKRLLAVHDVNGEAVEWDVATRQITWRAMPPDVGRVRIVAAFYLDTQRCVTVATSGGRSYATLYRIGNPSPLWSQQIATVEYYSAALDSARNVLALMPSPAAAVDLYRIEHVQIVLQQSVLLPALATALTIAADTATVALRDGQLVRYSLPSWTLVRTIAVPLLPHVALLYALPDGKRLAIGCRAGQPTIAQSATAPVYVLDVPTEQIIRSDRQAASTPVAVTASANARYLVFGFRGQPQAPLWDLATNMMLGQATTHEGTLADIAFSPDQRFVASSSATPPLELLLRTFLFPETALSNVLSIGSYALRPDTLRFAPIYAYTTTDTVFTLRLCNSGTLPLPLGERWIEGEPIFQLSAPLQSDTLLPGMCIDVPLRFSAPNPGNHNGALVIQYCGQRWRLPIYATARQRSIATPDTLDLGIACVGGKVQRSLVVLTNNDPVPLPIGGVSIYDPFRSPFRVVAPPRDTTIGASSGLVLTIEFAPTANGPAEGKLIVFYGGRDYSTTVTLRGIGVGGTVVPHVSSLAFLPEVPTRTLRLRNKQSGTVTITGATIEPPGGFRVLGTFPLSIAPNDSARITVEQLTPDFTAATLVLWTEPCSSQLRIPLVRFEGQARIRIADTSADVRGRASIAILARLEARYDYGDPLPCTLQLATHPRLFLPDTAWSPRGQAQLLYTVRRDDRRWMTIALQCSLSAREDTIAIVSGAAALGEQDSTHITFGPAPYWGAAVTTTTQPGVLRLTGLCGPRRTFEQTSMQLRVFPNPTSGADGTLLIESSEPVLAEVSVYSSIGTQMFHQVLALEKGTTTVTLPLSSWYAGVYTIVVKSSSGTVRDILVVL